VKDEGLQYLTPKELRERDCVAINTRRGDYVNNPNYQQLGMGYYIHAYDTYFKGKPIEAFSDDWAYIDLHYHGSTLNKQQSNEIVDFCMMASCKYHILSNSTFAWWAAYVSPFSVKVVRPMFYFDGPLEKINDGDFWPRYWVQIHNRESVYLFSDVTFIIPFAIDHGDRVVNIEQTIKWIRKHFNCKILVGQVNGDQIKHNELFWGFTHFRYDLPFFHRTKVLNALKKEAVTPYVFNWDADVITSPWQVYKAALRLREGIDIVYPFKHVFANVPRPNLAPFYQSHDVGVVGVDIIPHA